MPLFRRLMRRFHNRERLHGLLKALKGKDTLVILTHDNPDPDSLAGAIALAYLVESTTDTKALIAYGGIIGRAENRAFVKVLNLPLLHVTQLNLKEFQSVALIDTQPGTGNNSLPADIVPTAVFDHHPSQMAGAAIPFVDIREEYGSTSTILFEYVRAAGLKITPTLATAVYYAIKSDTRDLGMTTCAVDRETYSLAAPFVNRDWLVQIEHPPIAITYYHYLIRALERARIAKEYVSVHLGPVSLPDVVSQVADFLQPLDVSTWTLCSGTYENNIYLSLRTHVADADAGQILRKVVQPFGRAGGHEMMAGGKIPLVGSHQLTYEQLGMEIDRRFVSLLYQEELAMEPLMKPELEG